MTEKRFINDIDNGKLIDTKGELSTIHYSDVVDFYELWEFLNKLNDENEQLKQQLQKIQNSFELNITQNYEEFDTDKLYIKDNNTKIRLDGTNLFIEVYIPQVKGYYRFKYRVTGRSLMREFIENYNSKKDME